MDADSVKYSQLHNTANGTAYPEWTTVSAVTQHFTFDIRSEKN